MKRGQLIIGLILLQCSIAFAQTKKPKLVIGIVVDQMRWDYLYRFQHRMSNNGFKRLMLEGYHCQNTYLNYIPSYTAPGHASIYSGTVPAIHGIVGNDWIEQLQSKYCATDTSTICVGGSQKAGQMSPRALKTTTIGDELRLATNFRSRVYGIALKDRGAIFPAGHSANGAYWLDDSSGNFISSTYYGKELPQWLQKFNQKRWVDTLLQNDWETLYPIGSYSQSIEDNNDFEYLRQGETTPTFPHKVVSNNYKQIRSLPAGNTLSFKLAKALINSEELGQRSETDMLCLSLSSTDYIGHAYGPNSVEVEDLYLRLDLDLASFLIFLDHKVGDGNYTIFLTADHGAAHNANFLKDHKIPAGTLTEHDLERNLNRLIKDKLGWDSVVRAVMNYQIFLNETIIEKKNIDKESLKKLIRKYCLNAEGIAHVIDLENPSQSNYPEQLKALVAQAYYPIRCGSLMLIYEPGWYSDGKKGTTHGTWNPYDTHIPLLWFGWGIPKGSTFVQVEVSDIAATLAALLRIQVPNGCVGHCIEMR